MSNHQLFTSVKQAHKAQMKGVNMFVGDHLRIRFIKYIKNSFSGKIVAQN